MASPSPTPVAEVSGLDIAQFGVEVVATIATVVIAIAGVLIAHRAHVLNEEVRLEGQARTAREARISFAAEAYALLTTIVEERRGEMGRREASATFVRVRGMAMAHGDEYVEVVSLWSTLRAASRSHPGEEYRRAMARTSGDLQRATMEWARGTSTLPSKVELMWRIKEVEDRSAQVAEGLIERHAADE